VAWRSHEGKKCSREKQTKKRHRLASVGASASSWISSRGLKAGLTLLDPRDGANELLLTAPPPTWAAGSPNELLRRLLSTAQHGSLSTAATIAGLAAHSALSVRDRCAVARLVSRLVHAWSVRSWEGTGRIGHRSLVISHRSVGSRVMRSNRWVRVKVQTSKQSSVSWLTRQSPPKPHKKATVYSGFSQDPRKSEEQNQAKRWEIVKQGDRRRKQGKIRSITQGGVATESG
jgi:hypothetical protein